MNRTQGKTDKLAALRKTELFGKLPDDLLQKVSDVAMIRRFARNKILFSEHEEASGIYIVVRGEIRSVRQSVDGREQVLSTERPGSILAAVPVFNGGKFYSTAIADSDLEVLRIEKRDLHHLCAEHTQLLWNLARVLGHRVRQYAELVEMLALRNVEQRVAQHLLTIARERGVRVGTGCTVELTLTRTAMASRVGSAREAVSRAFTHLQKSELIQIQGRRLIHIPQMEALNSFACTESSADAGAIPSDLSSDMA